MLLELKVATLPVGQDVRKQLIEIVQQQLDAFAATPTDLGRTSVISHKIKTGEAQPFRHKLRAVPVAQRDFLEKELEHILWRLPFATAVEWSGDDPDRLGNSRASEWSDPFARTQFDSA